MRDPTKFLDEAFGKALDPTKVAVPNDVIDPMKAETDPNDEDFRPQNKVELDVAVGKMMKELPDDQVAPFYRQMKKTLDNLERGGEQDMAKKTNKSVEEGLRQVVRSMLIEMTKSGTLKPLREAPRDWNDDERSLEDIANDEELQAMDIPEDGPATGDDGYSEFMSARRNKIKNAAQAMPSVKHAARRAAMDAASRARVADEEEADAGEGRGRATSFFKAGNLKSVQSIADETGISFGNVRTILFAAEDKLKFVQDIWNDDELQEILITAVHDYITDLEDLGPDNAPDDLTPEDIQLLRDNPEMVMDLGSFRVYLQGELKERGYEDAFSKAGKQRRFADEEIGNAKVTDDRPEKPWDAEKVIKRRPKKG